MRGETQSVMPATSREGIWPRCGARCRGERAGRTCRAAGCGFGGRCWLHGGALTGVPTGSKHGCPAPARKVVVFSAAPGCITDWVLADVRQRHAWSMWAMPAELFARLEQADEPLTVADAAFVADALVRGGVGRDVAALWPQKIGFNVLLKLAERGRVAFALLHGRDLRRATRARVGHQSTRMRRVEADELLAALRAAGQRIPKGTLT